LPATPDATSRQWNFADRLTVVSHRALSRGRELFAMNIRSVMLAASAAVILAPAISFAQTPPKAQVPVAPKTEQLDPKACAHSDTQATVGQGGTRMQQPDGGGNLSEKLARSDGVICPPDQVDPEIKAPTPPGGPMPVVPPPGSPGGDPSVRPK
jgi:hypothetical protein